MAELFEKTTIGNMVLKNRLVRSATHEGMSDEHGFPGPALYKLYDRLAKGGVGLIITGYAYVSKDGMSPLHRMQAIDRDELVDQYRDLVDRVHEKGAKIVMQIAHCGRQTDASATGTQPISPSAVLEPATNVMPKEMTEDDIKRVVEDFAQGARRVKEAGFDAVQLHGAHGYLLSSFICPHTNRRTDQWGGSTENRVRIVGEIYRRCRELVGKNYPIMIKYSAYDKMEKGLTLEEGVRVGKMIAEIGFDCIEVSAGIFEDGGSSIRGNGKRDEKPPQAFNRHAARALKQKVNTPIMLVGGITDPKAMKDIIESGDADYISMCRALISDPSLPNKIREDKPEPARCIHCDLCLTGTMDRPLRCYYGKRPKNDTP